MATIIQSALSVLLMLAVAGGIRAEEREPERTDKLSDNVTRLIYAEGDEEWDIAGRGKVKFVPTPAQTREESQPRAVDTERGYITFSPAGRGGVLPEYRPADTELVDEVSLSASLGEFEPATFAIRPLVALGTVTFAVGDLRGPKGAIIPASSIDVYIVEPTVEQIGLTGNQVRWVAKWLRPGNAANTAVACNTQVYLDIHVPEDAKPGPYSGTVAIKPEKAKASSFTVRLKVLPLTLSRPMPWGFFRYDWHKPDERSEWLLWGLKEMRRAGMTQCLISPIHYQNRPGVSQDGTVDFSIYDHCIELYKQAGFEEPPIVAMEGLMYGLCAAMGKAEALKFKDYLEPGVKAEEVPAEVREFAGRVIRRIYDHALEAKWPPFYIYLADEPSLGSPAMEKAKFMYGLTRQVAPEMQTAGTVYTHEWWQPLENLLDLNICHYVHPCHSADGNRRWHQRANRQHTRLYGIDFIGPLDTYWEGQQITFTAEKGKLAGMMCWTQLVAQELDEPFNPYRFLANSWKGGPWCLRDQQGRVWRSLPWIGLREGIDDSRYLRTLRDLIADTRLAGRYAASKKARIRLQRILDEVPWVPGVRVSNSPWTAASADAARDELAGAALECQQSLGLRTAQGGKP